MPIKILTPFIPLEQVAKEDCLQENPWFGRLLKISNQPSAVPISVPLISVPASLKAAVNLAIQLARAKQSIVPRLSES